MKIVSHVIIPYNEHLDSFSKITVQHEGPGQAHLIFALQPFLRVLRGSKMQTVSNQGSGEKYNGIY